MIISITEHLGRLLFSGREMIDPTFHEEGVSCLSFDSNNR